MKSIIFIGTQKSGSSREAIKAADELGYYTVLYTDKSKLFDKRDEFLDVHLMQLCDLNDIEKLKNNIIGLISMAIEICAIVSFVDRHCYTANLLAKEFGLNHFNIEAINNMQNKILSRQILSQTPYVPGYMVLSDTSNLSSLDEIDKFQFPYIVKSPNSTGSKDVYKINNKREFNKCVANLTNKNPNEPILIEDFLDGPQYLVEVVVYNNIVNIIAILQQEITYFKHFIVTGYNLKFYINDKFYEKLKEAVSNIIKFHGLEMGTCHLEMRYVKEQWKLIEINPRISGGGMNRIIELGLGINLVKETLKLALGQKPNLQASKKQNIFAQYVTISNKGVLEKVTGKNKALNSNGVLEVYIKPKKGALLSPPLSMGDRYAYVIATGSNEKVATENAKNAASEIKFWISGTSGILPYNDLYQK